MQGRKVNDDRSRRRITGRAVESTNKWLGLADPHDSRATNDNEPKSRIGYLEIDDPCAPPSEPRRIVVAAVLSTDPLAWMHAHGSIDDVQYAAGRHWQELYERGAVDGVQSIDFRKEQVDGGLIGSTISESKLVAIGELRRLALAMGPELASLIEDVLGRGLFIKEASAMRRALTDHARRRWSKKLRQALDILAVELGFTIAAAQRETKELIDVARREETEPNYKPDRKQIIARVPQLRAAA